MKKFLLLPAAFLLLFTPVVFGQADRDLTPVYQHIAEKYNLKPEAVGDLLIKSSHISEHNQVENLYLVQSHNGIEIRGSHLTVAVLPNGRVMSTAHRLIPVSEIKIANDRASISAGDAIASAAASLGMPGRSTPQQVRLNHRNVPVYDKADIALQDIPVETVLYRMPTGEFRLAYMAELEAAHNGELYLSFVDAATGQSLRNESMTLHCQFEAGYLHRHNDCQEHHHTMLPQPMPQPIAAAAGQYYALPVNVESPNHGEFELIADPHDVIASPYGWHDTNGDGTPEYTHTRGNNVHAFLDRDFNNSPDYNVDGGNELLFQFPFNADDEPQDIKDAAAVNLFFRNNVMHDFAYRYGFNEAAGNFQQTNHTGLGAGGDFVNAHSQFGADDPTACGISIGTGTCLNNANFSTPNDGGNPRMRMFVWNEDFSGRNLEVLEPSEIAGKYVTGGADFGAPVTSTPVTGEVEIVDDGSFSPTYGCGPLQSLTGKIALIDRGICEFGFKVLKAQEAGAVAAIICNFEDATVAMAGGVNGGQVTIPSVSLSSSDCNRIRIYAGTGLVVSLVAPVSTGPNFKDASFDNGIIAHEYGHGISTRLTGGASQSGCLSNDESGGMGEGWSDFFALVTSTRPGDTGDMARGIGTYAAKEPVTGKGIRTYPYSTDMNVNPHTYASIQGESVPHGVGSVWTAMLWDLYWAFVDAYGWDEDVFNGTAGNNMAIQLVMDGLRFQVCNPTFADARDAILMADEVNYEGVNQCLIWSTFARRGLGANADAGGSASVLDGKEDFSLPIACLDEVQVTKTMTPEIVAGDNIEVTVRVVNYKDFPMTNVVVEDQIPTGTAYIAGSANATPEINGNTLQWNIPSLGIDEELTITYLLQTDPSRNSIRIHYDDMEGFVEERWDIGFDPELHIFNFWQIQDFFVHSGSQAWGVDNVAMESDHWLTNLFPIAVNADNPVYRFYHYYNTETGFDGGFLQISSDNGASWRLIDNKIFRNSYTGRISYNTIAIPNLFGFSGISSDDFTMTPVYIDLSEYRGEEVLIRHRFVTDVENGGIGWYIDDVELMDAISYNATVCVVSDETELQCVDAPAKGTIVDTEFSSSTGDEVAGGRFALMPNPAGDFIQVSLPATLSSQAMVTVYNLTGVQLKADKWDLIEGVNQKSFDISGLAPGMYILQVRSGAWIHAEKFIKE